jgi:hypothetical protein
MSNEIVQGDIAPGLTNVEQLVATLTAWHPFVDVYVDASSEPNLIGTVWTIYAVTTSPGPVTTKTPLARGTVTRSDANTAGQRVLTGVPGAGDTMELWVSAPTAVTPTTVTIHGAAVGWDPSSATTNPEDSSTVHHASLPNGTGDTFLASVPWHPKATCFVQAPAQATGMLMKIQALLPAPFSIPVTVASATFGDTQASTIVCEAEGGSNGWQITAAAPAGATGAFNAAISAYGISGETAPLPPGGNGEAFIYQEGGVTAAPIYATFVEAYNAAKAAAIPCTIYVDDSLSPGAAHVTALALGASYDFTQINLANRNSPYLGPVNLSFDDGATVTHWREVSNVSMINAGATVTAVPPGASFNANQLVLRNNASVAGGAVAPFITITATAVGGQSFFTILAYDSAIGQPPLNPAVKCISHLSAGNQASLTINMNAGSILWASTLVNDSSGFGFTNVLNLFTEIDTNLQNTDSLYSNGWAAPDQAFGITYYNQKLSQQFTCSWSPLTETWDQILQKIANGGTGQKITVYIDATAPAVVNNWNNGNLPGKEFEFVGLYPDGCILNFTGATSFNTLAIANAIVRFRNITVNNASTLDLFGGSDGAVYLDDNVTLNHSITAAGKAFFKGGGGNGNRFELGRNCVVTTTDGGTNAIQPVIAAGTAKIRIGAGSKIDTNQLVAGAASTTIALDAPTASLNAQAGSTNVAKGGVFTGTATIDGVTGKSIAIMTDDLGRPLPITANTRITVTLKTPLTDTLTKEYACLSGDRVTGAAGTFKVAALLTGGAGGTLNTADTSTLDWQLETLV